MHLGRATIGEGVSRQNSHPFKVVQKKDFGMVMCISHIHPTFIKAIGCVPGVIEILC